MDYIEQILEGYFVFDKQRKRLEMFNKGDNYMVPFYVLLVYIFSFAPEDARILLPNDLWNDGT